MKGNEQKIKCNVESCKFQDCHFCTLSEIEVGCSCDNEKATQKRETLCKSFEYGKSKTED